MSKFFFLVRIILIYQVRGPWTDSFLRVQPSAFRRIYIIPTTHLEELREYPEPAGVGREKRPEILPNNLYIEWTGQWSMTKQQ